MKTASLLPLRVWPIVLLLIGLAVYGSGLRIPYYADDFLFVHDVHNLPITAFFVEQGPVHNWYRPVHDAVAASIQRTFGLDTLPLHLSQLLLHVALCWLVFHATRRLGLSTTAAVSASLFMLITQANTHAILSNDTFSQVFSTVAGYLSLWLLYSSLRTEEVLASHATRPRLRPYLLSVAALVAALLGKESGISFLPMIGLVLLARHSNLAERRVDLLRAVMLGMPYLIVTIGYLLVRASIVTSQPQIGEGAYGFIIGLNIPLNIALLGFVTLLPVSSPAVFSWLNDGNLLLVGLAVASAAAVGLLLAYGMWRSPQRTLLLWLAAFALLALFPMVILNSVSELYAYNAAPFVAIIFGATASLLLSDPARRVISGVVTISLVVLAVANIMSIQHKAALMQANGERATVIMEQVAAYLDAVPPDGQMLLLNPKPQGLNYSVFMMEGFEVIDIGGTRRLRLLSGRDDLRIRVVEQAQLAAALEQRPALVLTLNATGTQVFPVDNPATAGQ